MIDRTAAKASFWSSKVGHAAIASIAAMTMMVLLSSQIQPGAAAAAPIAHPVGTAGALVEIA
ncbi:hypothetical protein [Erythrobacter sp. WG]|uniref:hypothetical protein n=1 Tax=Erythrobacter sp. WG TaxID=2985510 RepID=UPI00226FF9ED|nr:hypothetical protein [Erythrobacter sp. WG]MCX9148291.1 hypothetical protein [Erythrobacter sp. WG]